MSNIGLVHTVCGFLALAFGGAILLLRKGTNLHRLIGYFYVATMLALNVSALNIYDRYFGYFTPFHILAIVSLASVTAGFVPAYSRKSGWLKSHYKWMGWSYVGLLAATIAEIGVHLPLNLSPTARLLFTFIGTPVITLVGGYFLITQRQRTLRNAVLVSKIKT